MMTVNCPGWVKVLGLVVAGLCLAGCENKLTRENYDKIEVGMSVDQVVAILGPGEKMTQGGASKLAQDMIGDVTFAQAQREQRQVKQGLGDLTGQIEKRNNQGENGPGVAAQPAPAPGAAAPRGNVASIPQTPGAPARPPKRDRWVWKSDGVEITVEFTDDRVTTKNQDGL